MTGTDWAALIGATLTIAGALLKWWLSPKYKAWRDEKDRKKAHKANANKNGAALGDYFRKRSRK